MVESVSCWSTCEFMVANFLNKNLWNVGCCASQRMASKSVDSVDLFPEEIESWSRNGRCQAQPAMSELQLLLHSTLEACWKQLSQRPNDFSPSKCSCADWNISLSDAECIALREKCMPFPHTSHDNKAAWSGVVPEQMKADEQKRLLPQLVKSTSATQAILLELVRFDCATSNKHSIWRTAISKTRALLTSPVKQKNSIRP